MLPAALAVRLIAVGAAYVVGAKLGLALAFAHEHVTPVWPPTGIAVGALVLFGLRLWPGVFAGAVVANVLDGVPLHVAAAIAIGNTLAPVAATLLLRKLDVRAGLDRLRDVMWLIFGGGLAAMTISATMGTAVLFLAGARDVVDMWRSWWVGDAMGVALVAPLILTIGSAGRGGSLVAQWRQSAAMLVAFAGLTFAAVHTDSPITYLVIPFGLWISLQLGQQGAAAAVVIMSTIDVWGVTVAQQSEMSLEGQLIALQGVNATIAIIFLGFAAMMSERRRAADALRAAADDLEDRVRQRTEELGKAQRLARIGSFQWDAASDSNRWSDELYQIYRRDQDAEAPTFEEYLEYIRWDKRNEVESAIETAMRDGTSIEHSYPIVLRDGTHKWVRATVEIIKDDDGRLAGLRGTCQDITEQRVAEEALQASEMRFRALVESAPDASVVVDENRTIVLTNDQITSLLGYAKDELIGRNVAALLPPQLRKRHEEHILRYLSEPARRPMGAGRELFAMHKDGSLVPVDISLAPVVTAEGVLVMASLRDATERRRVEDALRGALDREQKATEHLRRLDQAKNAFLSAVSHELRTPLTAIIGFAELLQDDEFRRSEDLAVEVVDRLQQSASRLSGLLSDLLDIDRLQRGILEPHRRNVLARDVVERALSAIDIGRHVLTVDVDDQIVNVDPAQAERIIENLVTNAVKYTPNGTSITLGAMALDGGGLQIVVADNGPGISDELRERIFEPFARGELGTFTQGTGIGLALVDRFARLHGGRASVENRPHGGASFRVIMPGAGRSRDGRGLSHMT